MQNAEDNKAENWTHKTDRMQTTRSRILENRKLNANEENWTQNSEKKKSPSRSNYSTDLPWNFKSTYPVGPQGTTAQLVTDYSSAATTILISQSRSSKNSNIT